MVLLEHGQASGVTPPHGPAHLLRQLLDEVGDQQRDVLAATRSGGRWERDDVETVEEILAQDALGDGALDVAVRGGDEADVDLDVAGVAHLTDLPLLDGAEQLDLHGLGDLGDLVEKERAAIGGGEELLEAATAPVKAPLTWPNSSDSIKASATAPQLTETNGPLAARLPVEGLGHELLAGPALARDHHRRAAVGRLADGLEHVEDLRAAAYEVLEAALGRRSCCLRVRFSSCKRRTLQRVGNGDLVLVELEGLGDVVGAQLSAASTAVSVEA